VLGRSRNHVDEYMNMAPWTKVVTNPLGLAGFALFLVFGYLAKIKRNDERRWLSPVAFAIAAVALVGGLVLAYVQASKPVIPSVQFSKPAAPTQQQANQQVQQSSTGEGSPNVQGVQGDVTVTVDQSKGKTETQKPAEKKPQPQNK
jgi:hypothetical protein